jgi:protein-S-isoprenylcysteine O-methyltransferase Ste14
MPPMMLQDLSIARRAKADPRPASAVSTGVGVAGLVGFAIWLAIARAYGMDGPFSGLANLLAIGVPMVAWSLLVDKVHRNPSTGIDWSRTGPLADTLDISLTKLAGLWATWGAIAAFYSVGRWYWQGSYEFAMWCIAWAAPAIFVASIPYVIWIDRKLIEPRDGAWALGAWLIGQGRADDREAIYNHLRSWAVKGFFLAFMLSIVPGGFGGLVRWDMAAALADPGVLAQFLINMMFVIDVAFATVGYMLTMRPLDAHIRTANPYAAAWTAALICYPPFIMMGPGGPLNYSFANFGDSSWLHWFAGSPRWLALWGAVLVTLTAIYAWATVAFGLRFSNLTHRGILTHGPYAWTRHPAYWSKNAFWWIGTLPFLTTTGSLVDAARTTAILAAVSGVYYWRAKTEERHLGSDPAYQEYSAWIAHNGLWARLRGAAPAR